MGILISLGIHVISSQLYVALSSIGQGIMIGLIIIRLFMDRSVYKGDNFTYLIFILFIISALLSSVFSINPSNSFVNSKRLFLFAGFFVTFIFIKDKKQLRYFLLIFFVFSALLSTYEMVKYFWDFYTVNMNPNFSESRLEYFGYPITNAEIKMLLLLSIIPFLFIKEDFVLKKIWLVLLLIPILITLLLTGSRNAMLGLFIGVIVIGFIKNKKFLLIFVILVIIFIVIAPHNLHERILSIGDFSHPSNQSRFLMWKTGLKIIKDHFLLGIGDTDLLPLYKTYKIPQFSGEGIHLHNNFMQVLVSYGIIGFIVWLTMMFYIFYKQVKIYLLTRSSNVSNTLALISLSCMAAFMVSGLTEWNFFDFEFAAVLWFTLGLSYLAQKFYLQNAEA